MENQPGHPQLGMLDRGFRPFPSMLFPTLVTEQQHPVSSVNTASIQMPPLPYHPEPNGSSICPADDGYIWRKYGQQTIPGWRCPPIYYECAQANCGVKKSVAFSADGQVLETVVRGSHNHPRPSERWPRDGRAGFGPGSQDYVLPEVSAAAGILMPRMGEQLPSSSNSEEDDDGGATANGDFAGDASATESERRRSKSKVWEEFSAVLSDGKIRSAECKHCKKRLSGKSSGGTSHLRRHLKICPAQPATDRVKQGQSSSHPDSSVEKHWKFDQDKSFELLIKVLVSNLCSFPLTTSTTFRQFLAGICPTYDVVPQGAIQEKFLSIFQNEQLKLKMEIALAPGGVFLTVANWSIEYKDFISVTVHFIDKEWNMNRKIIRCTFAGCEFENEYYVSMFPDWKSFRNMTTENSTAAAEEIVKEVVPNWNLERKLLGISFHKSLVDVPILGLENNITEQNYLLAKCKLLSLPCIIGALHDFFGYDIDESVLETSRNWFQYMTCSPLSTDKYKEILSQLQINRPSFGSEYWHLTFYLLEAALQFNKVLTNPERISLEYFSSKPPCTQLKVAEDFCDVVRPIYHAIKEVSSPCNVTLNSHFHAIWKLKIALLGSSRKENINQVLNVEQMQMKFDQLWKKWYLWLSLAVVLDPRYKIKFLVFRFKEAFGGHAKRYIFEVRGKLYELFLQYTCHVDQQNGEHLNQRNNDLQLDTHGSVPVRDTSQNYIEQAAHEELGELIGYLEGEIIPQNDHFDILKWWKDNASVYPALARLARDILAIPVCAVSAESAFHENDERVSLFKRKMSPEVVEALICTQDWIKSSEISDDDGGNINMPT
ncbi:zinc finger BED domain-containing protein RICESLEEPER 2-like isoform X2 [Phragmites australis]|uniref:zinc finger BED domain-containing protein RICESLEEPER 2-like isoform X2 n=1 Tax=Phragmites australis TaxID=29695 RepID=UPI002D76829C|nr:zinc finger BED domain-containing protein RICESLEEPER 2-like isoform X2 [Phragmites australis]